MPWDAPIVSNEEKEAVWTAYHGRKPIRVPVTIATNPRVFVLNPALNRKNITFRQVFEDPAAMFEAALEHELYRRTVIHKYCDSPVGIPEEWTVGVSWQNTYEAAFFGAIWDFRDGQVPDVKPFLDAGNKERIFDVDIDHPLDGGIFRRGLKFYEEMRRLASGYAFHGRPVKVARYAQTGTDGPLTIAMSVRGTEFLSDMILDPDYAERLLDFITDAAIKRAYAFRKHWGDEEMGVSLADDSIQLISADMYRKMVMPRHRRFYDEFLREKPRHIHLCGDVMRHLKVLKDELNVMSFDTGFPVDFARIRKELGPDVEVYGGPNISLLLRAAPQEVYDETCRILESGIKEGGRFILREANNLPPCVPEHNLAAMYKACLDKGRY